MQWKIISFIHACWLKGTWFEAIMALRKCPGYPWFRQFLKRTPLLDKFMFLSPHQSKAPSPLTCRCEHVWCYKCNQVNVRIGTEGWEENATQTTSNRPENLWCVLSPFPFIQDSNIALWQPPPPCATRHRDSASCTGQGGLKRGAAVKLPQGLVPHGALPSFCSS